MCFSPPPITCNANHRSKAPHDNGHNGSVHLMWILDHRRQDVDAHFGHPDISFPKDKCRIEDIGPQNGSKHAFKWDLKAKMDETMGKGCTRSFGFHWAASILLKCYVLLHYFEPARGTKGGFWSQVSMERHNRTSTVPRFCPGKTEFVCVFGSN